MSKLYLIPTPIGNLEDITLRAKRILGEVDLVLAEDTRKTGFLLKHLEINKPIRSYHKFNEHKSLQSVIDQLLAGTQTGLVTDAGTPASPIRASCWLGNALKTTSALNPCPAQRPLYRPLLIRVCRLNDSCSKVFFHQKKGRNKRLEALHNENRTMVFYESPHRLMKTLEEFMFHFGEDRQASVSRELTKIHEETVRGTIKELIQYYTTHTVKGEFVIVVAGKDS